MRFDFMRSIVVALACVLTIVAFVLDRPLQAKDKDEIIKMQQELLILQRQVKDLQELDSKNTGEVKALLNQALDNVNSMRRDVAQIREIVDRGVGEMVSNADTLTQQVTRLSERLNATDQRIEKVQEQLEGLRRIFSPTQLSTNCEEGDKLYETAYGDYIRGNYALAVAQLRNYINCFPNTEGAANAQYLIGDSLYKQLDYKNAVIEFDRLIAGYPSSSRIIAARLKKADSLIKLERYKEASSELKFLVENHPGTAEALQASELLRQLPVVPERRRGR
ncbi:MAG: outer membrane protein assembly factor BamD [Acidobacteriota bacterium]|nr:outer membrane protein assembly factor BamD [Blastocatellia bacterium]MDW8411914.1 outer membrane protein assembly factor BamD [Acidobacteriota bacterium]